MMEPVREALTALVRGIALQPPRIPYISNVSGTWITAAQATDPAYWAEHLCGPVRFGAGIAALAQKQPAAWLEIGPAQALSSLVAQQVPGSQVLAALPANHEDRPADAHALQVLGELWARGVGVSWAGLHAAPRQRLPLPTYPFEHQRFWVGPRAAAPAAAPAAAIARAPAAPGCAASWSARARPGW